MVVKNRKQFIEKAQIIHNNSNYDYSKVNYIDSREKVVIICLKSGHGDFKQVPTSHLAGAGCPKCGGSQLKTNEEFEEQANIIHNYKYNYKFVNYINAYTKVIISCPIIGHGIFEQTPHVHLRGRGCPKCGRTRTTNSVVDNRDNFIKKAHVKHKNLYNYDKVIYKNSQTKVIITCLVSDHGDFEQMPGSHLFGSGCPKCCGNQLKNIDDFVVEANLKHDNKYKYDISNYINSQSKIDIICPTHGAFKQKANSHLQGHGCPRCKFRISKLERRWLEYLSIPDNSQFRQVPIKIGDKQIYADGYDSATKTIYEFYGSYWHGDIAKYDFEEFNESAHQSFSDLYKKTIVREFFLRANGYHIVSICESEFKKYLINENEKHNSSSRKSSQRPIK